MHGSDEVPEPLPIDDGGRLDVHDEVVKDGSHDSDLSVCVCLSHVSQGGETGRGQALVFQRVCQEFSFRDLGRYDLEIKYFGISPTQYVVRVRLYQWEYFYIVHLIYRAML